MIIELLQKAIREQIPVDIYMRIITDNRKPICEPYYNAFLVTGIDKTKNTFLGYAYEDRKKRYEKRIVTEEIISAVCKIEFPVSDNES